MGIDSEICGMLRSRLSKILLLFALCMLYLYQGNFYVCEAHY